jgi:hypothetical protein
LLCDSCVGNEYGQANDNAQVLKSSTVVHIGSQSNKGYCVLGETPIIDGAADEEKESEPIGR